MALDAATPRSIYNGNGSATAFPLTDSGGDPIVYASNAEINVAGYVTATDTWTDYTEGVEYTLAGTTVDGVVSDGVVTVGTAVATGTKLIIWRDTTLDQATAFGTAAAFSGSTHTRLADKHRRIDQELQDGITRALKLMRAEAYFDATSKRIANLSDPTEAQDAATKAYTDLLTDAVQADAAAAAASAAAALVSETNSDVSEASTLAYYNATVGNYVQPSSTVAYQHVLLDAIEGSFNGATTAFNLLLGAVAFTPESAAQLIVHINGVYQEPGVAYTIATTVITFTTAPATGDDCIIVAMKTAMTASDVGFTPASGISATTVQSAIVELVADVAAGYQPLDASLTAYAALTTAADKYVYYSGADTPVAGDITAFGRSILDDVDAATVRATIGVGLGTGDLVAANNLSDVANASTARTNLGVRTSPIDSIAASFNSSTTVFALTVSAAAFTPRSVEGIQCIFNGVAQIPGSAFTVAGTNITFTFTPQTGDACTLWAVNT